jgi:hypothetical protein
MVGARGASSLERGCCRARAIIVVAWSVTSAGRDVAADDLEEASGDANGINNFVGDDFVLHGGEKLRRDIFDRPFRGFPTLTIKPLNEQRRLCAKVHGVVHRQAIADGL